MKQKKCVPLKFNRFKYSSEEAAKLERAGEFHKASDVWIVASRNAYNNANRVWCEKRAVFCDRLARKPF